MKKVFALVLATALTMMLSSCIIIEDDGSETGANTPASGTNTSNNAVNVEEQITVELAQVDGEWQNIVCALITNGSTETIGEMEIQVLFYNEAGDIIAEDSDWQDVVLPGSTVASYVYAPEKYARYDYRLDIDVDANSGYKNHAKNVNIKTNLGDECLILQITNNADVIIEEIEYAVVLYKDGKIVDVSTEDVYDVAVGKTVIEESSTYDVDFDEYKVYINQAHTF